MNKRFIIINFAAFAVMLFLSTGCKQDGKQDAVPSYRVITVSSMPVKYPNLIPPLSAGDKMWISCRKYPAASRVYA